MSVIVKGMDMPKNCADCPLSKYRNTSLGQILDCKRIGTVWSAVRGTHDVLNHRHPNCPLVDSPEPHWIPVTEPPKSDFMPYYATCRSKVDDRENWVIEGMYTKYSGWEYPPMVRDDRAEIIAWMPKELPEPYKGVNT